MPGGGQVQNGIIYQITVEGNLDTNWSTWFSWMEITYREQAGITTLTGPVTDQAELRGILTKIWDLNKTVIAVTRLQDKI
jgi:hypothetical protein